MIELKVWNVHDREECLDMNFTNPLDAQKAAKGNGFWGSDANVSEKTIRIYESYEEAFPPKPADRLTAEEIASLKAKLTPREIQLLGLDYEVDASTTRS